MDADDEQQLAADDGEAALRPSVAAMPYNTTFQTPKTEASVDFIAVMFLNNNHELFPGRELMNVLLPCHSTGNGDCMLNSVSLFMCGTEILAERLRNEMAAMLDDHNFGGWFIPRFQRAQRYIYICKLGKRSTCDHAMTGTKCLHGRWSLADGLSCSMDSFWQT